MGAVIARLALGLAIALPWATLLPLHGALAVVAHAITLIAALHGAGLVIARAAGQRLAPPLLVIQWGIAGLVGVSGLAIACHVGTLALHAVLVFGFAAVHTGVLALGFADHVERVGDRLAGPRTWLVPAALLVALGVLAVVGAAGALPGAPFDDEGHVLAQLRRLLDTGQLGDPIGFPRRAQLGGQIALAAVASGAGDGFARTVEPLALALALGLALSRIRARDTASALWTLLAVAAAFAITPGDPLPCWTAVGLIVALYTMLGEAEPPTLPLAITAGALLALRYELAPIAGAALIAAWWRRRTDHRATSFLIAGAFAVAFPFLVARMVAWRTVAAEAHAQLAPPATGALVLRVALAAALAAPLAGVLRLPLPGHRALRFAAIATAVAVACLVTGVTGDGSYALLWPIALGFAITLVIELARTRAAGPAAVIAVVALCLVIAEGLGAPGRLAWSRRLAAAAAALDAVQRPPAEPADPYADLLASVPAGTTVAVWVNDPERLDYARLRILDLRTPAAARLRVHRWDVHASALDALVAHLPARFLLLELDDAAVRRTHDSAFYRFACPALAGCADDLEALVARHRVVDRRDNLVLLALDR